MAGRSPRIADRTATSAGISRLLAIEDALQRLEVRPRILWCVREHHAIGIERHFGPYGFQLPTHGAREYLQPARALQVIERVERLGDRWADHDDAVIREE